MILVVLVMVLPVWAFAQTQWKQVETVRYDWAGPGKAATFILEVPADYDAGGDFTRLRILTDGHPEFVLLDDDGLSNFRKEVCLDKRSRFCKNANTAPSDHLLFYPLASGPPLLFVFGWEYESSPGSFHALALDGHGMPHEILSLKGFDLADLIDVDGDGIPEIVGKKCFSQEWGNHLLTYDPYSVYRIAGGSTEKAEYSLDLSKGYNLKNYYGWAGPDCREDVAVVLHPPGGGRPIIMNSKEAAKISGRK